MESMIIRRIKRHVSAFALLSTVGAIAWIAIAGPVTVYRTIYLDGYDKNAMSLSFSMAKSFFSVLVGCAVDDGYFKSIDQPATDYVPELKPQGFTSVTLNHLLQMTSGIDYAQNDFPFGIHCRFYYSDKLEREILGLRLKEQPGTRFRYKSGDVLLLALALKRALGGKSIARYTQERLCGTPWEWSPTGRGASITRQEDSKRQVVASLPQRAILPSLDAST